MTYYTDRRGRLSNYSRTRFRLLRSNDSVSDIGTQCRYVRFFNKTVAGRSILHGTAVVVNVALNKVDSVLNVHWRLCKIEVRILVSKVAFIILSPSAIEASHPGLMRQSELFAIITQPIALMSVAACQASGRLCLFT